MQFAQFLSLVGDDQIDNDETSESQITQQTEALIHAPIFNHESYELIEDSHTTGPTVLDLIPQYGFLGIKNNTEDTAAKPESRLLLANTNVPWSAIICGSQGSGKSYTLSCLLELYLLQNSDIGKLSHPLAGLVMHYDSFSSQSTSQICESAYLCSAGIPVTVLVSPSNIWAMKSLYENISGLGENSNQPKVMPLYLNENQLDVSRILKLMSVDSTATDTPLYVEVVLSIIREMAMSGTTFTYTRFRERLNETTWIKGQETPLKMRLQMLESFLEPSLATKETKPAAAKENIWAFKPGTLTIVDLSDPFFLIRSGQARTLTNELTSVIRQQRHMGTRVLIATQEPTLSPELIELANATIIHRFLSPAWYDTLRQHLVAANKQVGSLSTALLESIVALRTGEALLFCPTAQVEVIVTTEGSKRLKALGSSYVKLKVRKRVTVDGGESVLATNAPNTTTSGQQGHIRMHVAMTKQAESSSQTSIANRRGKMESGTCPKARTADTTKTVTKQALIDSHDGDSKAVTETSHRHSPTAIATRSQLSAEANRQINVLITAKSWTSSTVLSKEQRRQLYADFESSLQLLPGDLNKTDPKMIFFATLGNSLKTLRG
ncbi:hypothetical protein JX266_014171 [Neoarthrinium moseri]|nr:hypothetical protein JX266_014171 [Neoarthrinium moseri]